ncbi:MAG: hypothetical protein ACRDJW_06250 [Thermomicrobiales bacterium]
MDSLTEITGAGLNGHGEGRPSREDILSERFAGLIDAYTGPIGRVVGSEREPAGAHQFCFWAADGALSLDVGHIVVAFSEEAAVIGVVDEPRRFSDLRTFLDDYFDRHVEEALLAGEPPTLRPEILVFTVSVLATKHLRDDVTSNRPPVSGPVYYATREAIDYALGRPDFSGAAIPVLLHTNGNVERDDAGEPRLDERGNVIFQRAPVWLDEDYLLGPEAGHANWTGQSGLATKTSHALFLISAIFQRLRRPDADGKRKSVAALMFNVKGPDLLWLDKPAVPPEGYQAAYEAARFKGLSERDREAYRALDLEPEPFDNLRIFAPYRPGMAPFASHGSDGAIHLASKVDHQKLNTLRNAPAETTRVYPILWALDKILYQPHKVFEYGDLDDMLWGFVYEVRDTLGITSLHALADLFGKIEAHFEDEKQDRWHGHHKATILKARNRFNGLPSKFGGLLTDGTVNYGHLPQVDHPFQDQEVRVVDIAGCNSNVQELIVSNLISSIWREAEKGTLGVDKVIVFVDELNKYAPAGGQGGLRDTLVDIASRGRHLNVVLFGAQQFRSKVDDEVLGNSGTSFYGRIGDEELTNSAYRSLSETAKAELLGLKKGRLLARHAHFRAPVFGAFPLPPTVPGMAGQRIFNDVENRSALGADPGEVVVLLLKRLMGDGAPKRAEVLTLTNGHDGDFLLQVCSKVEIEWERRRTTTAAARLTPWAMVRNSLQNRVKVIRR